MSGKLIWNGTESYFSKLPLSQESSHDQSYISSAKFINEWQSGKESFAQNTSGSTGKPKTISISRQQMIASAKRTAKALNINKGTSALLCINPEFIGGKMMLVRAMEFEWNLTLVPPSSNPEEHLKKNTPFSFAALVPLQLQSMLGTEKGRAQLNNIDTIIIGGAPIGPQLEAEMQSLSAKVFSTYGMTETVSHIALKSMNGIHRSDLFQILDGISVAIDERNCLRIKADVTLNEWVQTNDVVELRGSEFKWLGRADFVINSGGVKIHLDQLESDIEKLLNTEVVLLKQNHDQLGETFVAVIVNRSNKTSSELKSILESSLAKYHKPNEVYLVDSLPRTSSGKVDRLALCKQLKIDQS
ncbi:AMP-binding protein [uncultured Roseivirga sp.]|uniref:AMP-binding protein n=1 Tax=uncultured Roseivirga sp. TaxID=543088 RepID=UPI0030DC323B|tara:strand:+ start:46057 stop:47130 length:1074 start_codon:yes stop_codon:yes gene_type:complete